MNEEVGLHGQQYQWLTTMYGPRNPYKTSVAVLLTRPRSFYITYLVGEFPSTWLLQRFNMGRVLTLYMVGWCKTTPLTQPITSSNADDRSRLPPLHQRLQHLVAAHGPPCPPGLLRV